MSDEGIQFFELDPRQQRILEKFTEEIYAKDITVTGLLSFMKESTESLRKAKKFITENPELVSKIIHQVNKNPKVIARLDEQTYKYIKERFALPNKEYYVPPISMGDPMDPVAALPAALAVAVVACALMFVGRGGLRGVV